MLSKSNWRELFHRIHGPRRHALSKWMKNKEILNRSGALYDTVTNGENLSQARKKGFYDFGEFDMRIETTADQSKDKPTYLPRAPTHKSRFNKWWVSNNGDFIEQVQVIEDPRVIERRQTTLPDPTLEDLWKKNQCPFFTPFDPYVKVVNYPRDPDAKHLYPATVPKWKEFMSRRTPTIPRTWY